MKLLALILMSLSIPAMAQIMPFEGDRVLYFHNGVYDTGTVKEISRDGSALVDWRLSTENTSVPRSELAVSSRVIFPPNSAPIRNEDKVISPVNNMQGTVIGVFSNNKVMVQWNTAEITVVDYTDVSVGRLCHLDYCQDDRITNRITNQTGHIERVFENGTAYVVWAPRNTRAVIPLSDIVDNNRRISTGCGSSSLNIIEPRFIEDIGIASGAVQMMNSMLASEGIARPR